MRPYCDRCEAEVSGPHCERHPTNVLLDLDDPSSAAFLEEARRQEEANEQDVSERFGMVALGFVGAVGGLLISVLLVSSLDRYGGTTSVKALFVPPVLLGTLGVVVGRYVSVGRRARRALAVVVLVAIPTAWWLHTTLEENRRAELDAQLDADLAQRRSEAHRQRILRERCGYEFERDCREEGLRLIRASSGVVARSLDPEGAERDRRIGRAMLERGCELGDQISCDLVNGL